MLRRLPTPLLVAGLILIGTAAALYIIPSNEYVFLPDPAQPLAPYVKLKGEKPDSDGGGIYYVAVTVKKASILEKLFPGIHDGASLYPASAVKPPGPSSA